MMMCMYRHTHVHACTRMYAYYDRSIHPTHPERTDGLIHINLYPHTRPLNPPQLLQQIWKPDSSSCWQDLREHKKEIYTIRWSPTGPGSDNPGKRKLFATCVVGAQTDMRVYVCLRRRWKREVIHDERICMHARTHSWTVRRSTTR